MDKVADCCIHIVRVEEKFSICANINEMSITSVWGDDVEMDRAIYLIRVCCNSFNVNEGVLYIGDSATRL